MTKSGLTECRCDADSRPHVLVRPFHFGGPQRQTYPPNWTRAEIEQDRAERDAIQWEAAGCPGQWPNASLRESVRGVADACRGAREGDPEP